VNTGPAVLKINGLVPLDVSLAPRSTVQPSYTMQPDSLSAALKHCSCHAITHSRMCLYIKDLFFNLHVYGDSSKQHTPISYGYWGAVNLG